MVKLSEELAAMEKMIRDNQLERDAQFEGADDWIAERIANHNATFVRPEVSKASCNATSSSKLTHNPGEHPPNPGADQPNNLL